jgi:hypothetical protein
MGTMKKVGPPILDLEVGHKCNESTQKLKDGEAQLGAQCKGENI